MTLDAPNTGMGALPPVVLIYNNEDRSEEINCTLPIPTYCTVCNKVCGGDCHYILFDSNGRPNIDEDNGEFMCLSCMELRRAELELELELEKEAKK